MAVMHFNQSFLTSKPKISMKYTGLSQTERCQIYALIKEKQTQSENPQILGCHKSNISQERSRCCVRRGIRPRQANNLFHERSQGTLNT
jgi:transposase, IS30 family